MGKTKNNQSGFSAVEVVLILIIVVLVGVVGFMVYNNHSKKTASITTVTTTKPTTPKATPVDSTASWIAYVGPDGKISLKYPKTWATASNPDLCTAGILLLGSDSNSVGKCATENFGQISVSWQASHDACSDLDSDAWTVNSKETIKVSGVSGLKQTATAKDPGQMLGAPPEGTPTVNYCFNSGGYIYRANYTKLAAYPDALNDFNLMVTKTLKFGN